LWYYLFRLTDFRLRFSFELVQMTDPLTPIDLDLRDFGFMPLEVVRLRDSDLAALASGDEFRAAVLLWCAAWHQVPAASLPNDDRLLAKFAGFGRDMKGWNLVRIEALRGFVECNDGRLYHPVIADIAIESGSKKKKQISKTSKATEARIRKAKERRDENRHVDRNGPLDVVQGRGRERKGEERTISEADKSADIATSSQTELIPFDHSPMRTVKDAQPDIEPMFRQWYETYPKRVDPKDALKLFTRVIRNREATFEQLLTGAQRYAAECAAAGTAKNFIKAPSVWLNKGSWMNEAIQKDQPANRSASVGTALAGIASRMMESDFDDRSS
jgi:hypothetical protein